MAPKKEDSTSGENGGLAITPGDMSLLDAILKNCGPEVKPGSQANWDNIATQLESKSAHSVKERFRVACKKYHWFEADSTGLATPSSSPKKKNGGQATTTPAKKRAGSPISSDDVEAKPTPAKKRKRAPKGKDAEQEKAELAALVTNGDGHGDTTEGDNDGILGLDPDEA